MKKIIILQTVIMLCTNNIQAQVKINYDPSVQPEEMQYFSPVGNQYVGDCIPFYHGGTYYLYWLLDEGHHSALNGLGAHQWAVSTTKDLKNWTHHPIAVGIDEDWEKSICTGSVAFYKGKYYAFYATRLINGDNEVNEQLSYAVGNDGITYVKQKPNPFYTSAPGYSKRNFRDPKVTVDKDGIFHLFVTSNTDSYAIGDGRGVLVHLTSKDLKKWDVNKPLLSGQIYEPECPDYFSWNDWYYLVYGLGGDTYYVKSRNPYGPWDYPESQAFVEQWSNVAKTAEFTGNRRILAGWIPSRHENRDNGGERFGGNVVLREVTQLPNGDLAVKFPAEVIPATGNQINNNWIASENAAKQSNGNITVDAPGAIGGAYMKEIPYNCRITLEIEPEGNNNEYGLFLRCNDKAAEGYKLSFSPTLQTVRLHDASINTVSGLDKGIKVDIILKNDIIDVCIDNKRCIVNRLPEKKGDCIWLYARQGKVKFKNIKVFPLL
jgi:sucrose-6-phosphate hydrolase SacC (GH32 family)